jgi:hypothetical protein
MDNPFEGCQKYEIQHHIHHHGGIGPNRVFIRGQKEIAKIITFIPPKKHHRTAIHKKDCCYLCFSFYDA